jgi:hypothetical protein
MVQVFLKLMDMSILTIGPKHASIDQSIWLEWRIWPIHPIKLNKVN